MSKRKEIIIAAKCAPSKKILSDIEKAGIEAVELFLSDQMLDNLNKIVKLCKQFPFRYALHAPRYGYRPDKLVDLAEGLNAEVFVFHNLYWEDEWKNIVEIFKDTKIKLCVENIDSCQALSKIMRRYGLGMCLDLEHLQIEGAGFFEEEFVPLIKRASHIHLTGYIYGSELWHTHIHRSPKHSIYLLNLLKDSGYSGFIVSEAGLSQQNYKEFKQLNDFYKMWKKR